MTRPTGVKYQKWCLLRDNQRLHSTITAKLRASGLALNELETLTGIRADRISKYLRKDMTGRVNQKELLLLADYFGIEVDITIKIVK